MIERHEKGFSVAQPHEDDQDQDLHRNAPTPSDKCYYGLVGEIARDGSENTEAHPIAIAANTLALLGVAVGPAAYLSVGDSWQHANLFWCHVGTSGDGRKGTAKALPLSRLTRCLNEICAEACPQLHDGALASGEGLAIFVHDGYEDGKNEVPPVTDKRLLVILEELDGLLTVSKREGNTLSAVIRGLWDSKSIRPATKGSRLWATNPHIGLTCDVTATELRERLNGRDLTNGFANRFVFFHANRPKLVPNPKPTPTHVVQAFAQRIREIINFAGADEGGYDRDSKPMKLDEPAMEEYRRLYLGYASEHAPELVRGLLVRRPAVLLRLAMTFALTDQTLTIGARHIEAAAAWVQFWTDSVAYIFSSDVESVQVEQTSEMASKLLQFLASNGQSTRTEIFRKCFGSNAHRTDIDNTIDSLLRSTPPKIHLEVKPSAGPKPTKIYSLPKRPNALTFLTQNQQPCGLQADSPITHFTKDTHLSGAKCVSAFSYEQSKQAANPHESSMCVKTLSAYAEIGKPTSEGQFKGGTDHLSAEIF